MKLHNQTQQIFTRFQETGSIGEGAKRSVPDFEEKMTSSNGAMAADMFSRWDNDTTIDQDSRQNWVKLDMAQAEKRMNSEMDEAFDELIGPGEELPKIGKEDLEEMREALRSMGTSEEEIDEILSGKDSKPTENGTMEGYVKSDGSSFEIVIQTSSDKTKDIEYYVGDDNGYKFMNATDNGDNLSITAISNSFVGNDEVYKETMNIAK